MKKNKRLFFTGFLMGLADLVPGVSGGTIAFLFGVYDELLYTIKLLTGEVPKLFFCGKFKKAFSLIPFSFLLPLLLGVVSSIFGLVHIVAFLLKVYPGLIWAIFFGMVLGTTYVIFRRIKNITLFQVILMAFGFVLTFFVVGLPSLVGSTQPIVIFATGVLAIIAMILPGISGSLIMVLLGQYEIIINAVADRNITTLFVFLTGIIFGLSLFVRLLSWLLKHYHTMVVSFLVGVMAGSLRRIWPIRDGYYTDNYTLFWIFAMIILGFAIVFVLEKLGVAKDHDDINTAGFKKEFKEIEG
jgi:putative membrane protein